ncbi:GNAT family N-acetyltransferase [Velocimicrobium porci]|uniref:Uncharacterized protein n=1 Tax=Velocimicrobium porci TaxID=2606634 RepID=A0A6L5Y162_9FIRM|nr:hypothetical protein [Velocimicrobium porci]MSS64886.1 hypothetical protein [Velocimicrobium porci]
MDWEIKKFAELTTDELYEILKIRTEVFIVEQHCAYQDIDSKDKESYHLFLKEQESITAYMRILPRGISYKELLVLCQEKVQVKRELFTSIFCLMPHLFPSVLILSNISFHTH